MTSYLYRNFRRAAIAVSGTLLLLAPFSHAQLRDRTQHQPAPTTPTEKPKSNKRGPRAIAVVEFLPGGGTRLVPIALWIDDRYYDASLYGANPEPMALEPETVYEATDYGEPTGLFTVTTPKQVNGNWVGDGHWKPRLVMDEKLAQQAAKQPKAKPKAAADDERPVLRRGSGGDSTANAASSDKPAAPSSGTSSSTPGSSTSNAGSTSDDDPDRPILKKPAPAAAAPASPSSSPTTASAAPPSSSSSDDNDPNRPVLRRGMPAPEKPASSTASKVSPAAGAPSPLPAMEAAHAKLAGTMAQLGHRSYPAISDAGTYEPRSLLYAMNSQERTSKSQQMAALALDAIRKFTTGRNSPALPKTAAVTDYELRAFDLDYSNSPTLVLTAKLPVETAKALRGGTFEYFVTVVAREDINGTPIKIFSSVTDSNHLDAYSRMEIIDAVDADSNGRGDLLFRQYSDVGINYGLYRIFPYEMKKVFEGGSGM